MADQGGRRRSLHEVARAARPNRREDGDRYTVVGVVNSYVCSLRWPNPRDAQAWLGHRDTKLGSVGLVIEGRKPRAR